MRLDELRDIVVEDRDSMTDTRKWEKCGCECRKCLGRNTELCTEPYDSNYDYEHRCLDCNAVWLSYSGEM